MREDGRTRRERTVDTILERAVVIMAEVGVAGLTMTTLARAMGIQPPSLYKYFGSVRAVHDALFRRGHEENLRTFEDATASLDPGLGALRAGLTADARWAVAHPVLAQLLFWRPVPGFVPSAEAMAPADALVDLLRGQLSAAVERGELSPAARTDEALAVLGSLHFGVISQHLANQPEMGWSEGVYPQAYARVIDLFVEGYRPDPS